MCEIFDNRQEKFIVYLRPLRAYLIKVQQSLKIFECELERGIKTRNSAQKTVQTIKTTIQKITKLTTHNELNIPPDENEVLRKISYDLTVLCRVIEEVASYAPEIVRCGPHKNPREEVTFSKNSENEDNMDKASSNLIDENCSTIEKLLNFIDKKTERRWWLKDGIVDMLDQYFLKHTKPEEIKLSIITTLPGLSSKH
uniref:Mediator complex subunit 15 n=1 Tax=Heterorhabditis bacteriophora TaxID=37862 RepID=A0A1I7WAQ2_HETBA